MDIEKNQVRQARANQYNIAKPPGNTTNASNGSNNSFFEDNLFGRKSQQQHQTQLQEEIDLQALEEQERAIRELEVFTYSIHNYISIVNTLNIFQHFNCRKTLWA